MGSLNGMIHNFGQQYKVLAKCGQMLSIYCFCYAGFDKFNYLQDFQYYLI